METSWFMFIFICLVITVENVEIVTKRIVKTYYIIIRHVKGGSAMHRTSLVSNKAQILHVHTVFI